MSKTKFDIYTNIVDPDQRIWIHTVCYKTLLHFPCWRQILSSADKLCKQFGHRSGSRQQKHGKLPSMQRVKWTSRKYSRLYAPHRDKTCPAGFANNKGADQPAQIAWASAQTDQCLFYSLTGKYHISTCFVLYFNTLASLCS